MSKRIFLFFIILNTNLLAQNEIEYDKNSRSIPFWAQQMYCDSVKADIVIDLYTDYYKENKFIKNKHTQYYKRWIRSFSREISESHIKSSINNNQWQCIGPWDFDINAASRSYAPGSSHIYTVEQSLSNPNVVYAGTATAGAWKSTDKGNNWSLITKDIKLNKVYSIEIDFLDFNTVYISGNGGIYKTTDGGNNWNIIGDAVFTNLSHSITDIKLSPNNNQIIFVATNNGLYKSINGGDSFSTIMSGSFQEIEFHPINTDTVYFIKQISNRTEFYRSVDGGNSLIQFSNGWPNPSSNDEQKRTEIAVSVADPNKIVALCTGSINGGSGLYGLYVSNDNGENWNFRCCGIQEGGIASVNNINMMGWQDDGSDDGGQYYYDLALAVNPYNADIIHVGGVNHWVSNDGGITFTCPSKWSHPYKKGYVHADIHDINYFGNDLWFASDGGVFYSNNYGDSITKRMFGIAGTDFWGFGSGFKDGNVMLGGTYHNGTLLKDNNTYLGNWISTDGGDNIRGFVNYGNPRMAYSDYGGKILSGDRNLNISTFSVDLKPNASYIIGESSQMEFYPTCFNWHYIGNDSTLWITKDNGKSYEAIYHFNDKVTSIEVSWNNPNVIYVATWESWWGDKKIWKTNDKGQTWTNITPTNINGQDFIPYDISISSYDENTLWIARCHMYGKYTDANGDGIADILGIQVFKSINGGQSWINLTTPTLDNIKITNIEHQRGSDGGIYLGTRSSVYYINNNMNDWEIYNNNLPENTLSTELDINYEDGKLFNATNRSVYEISLYENTTPSAQISADKLAINCTNDTIQFVDHSALRHNSASWNWTFPGGNPSSSTLENPTVVYSSPGKYSVTLTVTDSFGTSTQTINNLITYNDSITNITNSNIFYESFNNESFPPVNWIIQPNLFSWESIYIDSGINCTPDTVAYVNHYSIQQPGKETYLITNKIKLGGGNIAENWLTYDYSYSGYSNSYNDGFRIDISKDCGATWDSIYGASGTGLQTTNYYNNEWFPDCISWNTDSINLSSSGLNNDTILVRFTAINDYGNNFFLDNIKVNGKNILNLPSNTYNTKKLIKTVDILGRETKKNIGIFLQIYDNGSVEKKILLEK
tara:strand:- start:3436 stop:6753 length:3318 start_codon:yes stop_codon:yes gene_type:complete